MHLWKLCQNAWGLGWFQCGELLISHRGAQGTARTSSVLTQLACHRSEETFMLSKDHWAESHTWLWPVRIDQEYYDLDEKKEVKGSNYNLRWGFYKWLERLWFLKSIRSDPLLLTSPQDASWALLQCTICIISPLGEVHCEQTLHQEGKHSKTLTQSFRLTSVRLLHYIVWWWMSKWLWIAQVNFWTIRKLSATWWFFYRLLSFGK
jgi:hypothetical protein